MGSAMGRFCLVCFRGDAKKKNYYDHIKHIHDTMNKGMILLLDDSDLKVFLRKLGTERSKRVIFRIDTT